MATFDEVLETSNAIQHSYSAGTSTDGINAEKLEAKRWAMSLLGSVLPRDANVLDVGGELFYHQYLDVGVIDCWNLPDDMHVMDVRDSYDGVIAMHVLEHSPAPLLVLRNIYDALFPGGHAYIAVPHPTEYFETGLHDHLTVMSPRMWRKLIEMTGFSVLHQSDGQFNPFPDWIEERFLCLKPVMPVDMTGGESRP